MSFSHEFLNETNTCRDVREDRGGAVEGLSGGSVLAAVHGIRPAGINGWGLWAQPGLGARMQEAHSGALSEGPGVVHLKDVAEKNSPVFCKKCHKTPVIS